MQPLSHAKHKLLRALLTRKGRAEHGRFVGEGPRLVAEGVRHGVLPEVLVVCVDRVPPGQRAEVLALAGRLETVGVAVAAAEPSAFIDLSDTESGQGVLASYRIPAPRLELLTAPGPCTFAVLDGLQDPGNAGTAWRAAAAFGATALLVTPGTVDPFNPKVVRASMGAVFTVPVLAIPGPESLPLDVSVYVLRRGGAPVFGARFSDRTAMVVGGEARGPGSGWGDATIAIPQTDAVESLNAGVALSIALAARFGLAR